MSQLCCTTNQLDQHSVCFFVPPNTCYSRLVWCKATVACYCHCQIHAISWSVWGRLLWQPVTHSGHTTLHIKTVHKTIHFTYPLVFSSITSTVCSPLFPKRTAELFLIVLMMTISCVSQSSVNLMNQGGNADSLCYSHAGTINCVAD